MRKLQRSTTIEDVNQEDAESEQQAPEITTEEVGRRYIEIIDRMAKGNREDWEFFLNMNWIEFDNYMDFWIEKQKAKGTLYKNAKSSEQIMIRQLNYIIENG